MRKILILIFSVLAITFSQAQMKIVIASLPGQGGIDDATAVQTQVLIFCPTATTTKVYYNNMSDAVSFAISNGYNGIARNVSDFGSSYTQAAIAKAGNVWISWGHGAGTHVLLANPPYLVENAVGVGKGTGGVNAMSYGAALDFFVDGALNESNACGAVAGRIGQILLDNPTYTFENARNLLRKNSSNWPAFETDGGYGAVNMGAVTPEKIDVWTPAVPADFTVVRSDTHIITTATWNPQADATTHRVYRSTTLDGIFQFIGSTATNQYVDSGLDPVQTYCYEVSSYNSTSQQESATVLTVINSQIRLPNNTSLLN